MSEKMNYKVYVHIAPNGKRYYGITKQEPKKRWQNGKKYGYNDHFTNAINYYGWDNFEHIVIARGLTEEEAKWLEIELIREFDTTNRNKGYNITKGGDSCPMNNEETRKKVSEAKKGHEVTEEHKQKLSESHKGKKHTEETRKRMSETRKGKKRKPFSEEHKQKLSESHKGENNPKATKVYCVELDMVFNTVTEASKFVGCSQQNISTVLNPNKRNKTAKGYHWKYVEDKDKLRS